MDFVSKDIKMSHSIIICNVGGNTERR